MGMRSKVLSSSNQKKTMSMTESNDKVAQRESGEFDPSGVESDHLEMWPGEHKERSFQSSNPTYQLK